MTARRFFFPVLCLFILGLALVPALAGDQHRERGMERGSGAGADTSLNAIPLHINFIANASGLQVVPSVITQGRGNLRARLNSSGDGIEYRLSYDLEGIVRAAHLHIGQAGVNGAAAVVLCSNQPNLLGGSGPPPCLGPSSGTVSGVLYESDITGADNQGVNSLGSLLIAMMARSAYVNVHSDMYPAGEVRGQLGRLHLSGVSPVPGSLQDSSPDEW